MGEKIDIQTGVPSEQSGVPSGLLGEPSTAALQLRNSSSWFQASNLRLL